MEVEIKMLFLHHEYRKTYHHAGEARHKPPESCACGAEAHE